MKRDERNQISRRRILDSAIEEFGTQGYGLGSVNSICSSGEISKGILYHYYRDKDELYLACVSELFTGLTAHISQYIDVPDGSVPQRLERYFSARMEFFSQRPMYHKLFCEVAIAPPPQLSAVIREIRAPFDELNVSILTQLLNEARLRPDVTVSSAVETFRMFQDFINARWQTAADTNPAQREAMCRHYVDILLYGVFERSKLP